MGYCMHQIASEFFIAKKDRGAALEAIKEIANNSEGYMGGRYSWVPTNWRDKDNLPDMLQAWRWSAEVDEDGNIFDLCFEGEKLGDCEIMFSAVASFVKPGSFIEMQGEDGERWRWVFDGEQCTEKQATLTWD